MPLENKLGLTDEAALARAEEKISKTKALELYDTGLLDAFSVGTFAGLQKIHGYLFGEIYPFAGQMRTVNIAKGNFRSHPSCIWPRRWKASTGCPSPPLMRSSKSMWR